MTKRCVMSQLTKTKRCVMSQLTNAQFSGLSDRQPSAPGVSVELSAVHQTSRSRMTSRPFRSLIEMGQSSCLVAGIVPGVERHWLKKLVPDAEALLLLLELWRDEATKPAGRLPVSRSLRRDCFWLARSLLLFLGRQAHSLSSADLSESVGARLSRRRSRSPWRET